MVLEKFLKIGPAILYNDIMISTKLSNYQNFMIIWQASVKVFCACERKISDKMCLKKILNATGGPIQIWSKVPAEISVWCFVLTSSAHMLAKINGLCIIVLPNHNKYS